MAAIIKEGDIVFGNDTFYVVDIVGSEKAHLLKYSFELFKENPEYGFSSMGYMKSYDDITIYKDLEEYSSKHTIYENKKYIVVGYYDRSKCCSPVLWDLSAFHFHQGLQKYKPIILKNLFSVSPTEKQSTLNNDYRES